jgi:small GTP-binding protein
MNEVKSHFPKNKLFSMGCLESRPISPTPGGLNVQQPSRQRRTDTLDAKVVLLGDSGVGKSSLSLRFCQGRFPSFHEVTIGAAFLQQTVRLRDGSQVKLSLWDTGGQERFRSMSSLYYRDAAGAILVYDCTDSGTFESVKYWVEELRAKGPADVVISVAANKSDQPSEKKKVDPAVARSFCEQNNMLFFETSALSGDNVSQLFETTSNKIVNQARGSS